MNEISESGEEDTTDPSVELPERTQEIELPSDATLPPPSGRPPSQLPPPPPIPNAMLPRLGAPPARLERSGAAPVRRNEERPPAAPPLARAEQAPLRKLPARLGRSQHPPPLRQRSPSVRPGSIPPARMPKPSDAPPPRRSDLAPPQRQRFLQMETELNATRSSVSRQRHELDELRDALNAKEAQIERILASLPSAGDQADVSARLERLDASRRDLAAKLHARFSEADLEATAKEERLAAIESRLETVEEGSEAARIRMRLERVGHRLDKVEARLDAITDPKLFARIERMESLFEELASELREQRDASPLDAILARLSNVEQLVLSAGKTEEALKEAVEQQTERIARLETVNPPSFASDDLTKIKGVGPKFARRLTDLGYGTFESIAAWTAEDLDRVAGQLGVKASRIRKAGWVAEAAKLIADE